MINSNLKNANILIVDDQQANIDILNDLLIMQGYQYIETTIDPREVIEIYQTFNPDLILLDLMMPHLSGFQVMEQLKQIVPPDTYLPILVLTADATDESKQKALSGGAKDFLTKPFDLVEVTLRIKNLLETRYLHLQLQNQNIILEEKVKERTIELKRANDELLLLDQAKSDFLGIISHAINTPLNGIIGFTNILKEELQESELFSMLHILETSAQRLERFSRISLLITRLKTKNVKIEKENIEIKELIDHLTAKFKSSLENKNINFRTAGIDSNLFIKGERELVQLSFESLMDNAIKYSQNDGEILIQIKLEEKNILCEFTDNGTGFSHKELDNLFRLFSPGNKDIDENEGLDLALVKLIMESHNGSIAVNNNDKQGATVTLAFPIFD